VVRAKMPGPMVSSGTALSTSQGMAPGVTVTGGTVRAPTTRLPLSLSQAGRVGPAKA